MDDGDGLFLEDFIDDEAEELMTYAKDFDDLTIDVIFVNEINSLVPAMIIRGFSMPDSYNHPRIEHIRRTVVIALNRTPFTTAHEIGHVLLDLVGHFQTNDRWETYRNLMRAGTSNINAVNESKRLILQQCERARTATNLPQGGQ